MTGTEAKAMTMVAADSIAALVARYDPEVFDARRRQNRVRMIADGDEVCDVLLGDDGSVAITDVRATPDAVLAADTATWAQIASDLKAGMAAYGSGRLSVRRNLHVGIGFLAATSGSTDPARLRFRTVTTAGVRLSIMEAGTGPAVLAVHGLGATMGSFVPTVVALGGRFRMIALDLPGCGDSDKPIGAPYDPRFFAAACVDLLDALSLDRAHLIGNSLGGRIALEVGLSYPDRVGRLGLLAPSLAWRRGRSWAPLLRLTRPELGLVQLTPRPLTEAIVRRLIPGAGEGWAAAGVDEFLRAYHSPAGRAAFYATARHIVLDEPHGETGFWTRLPSLQAESLFVWGRRDRIVPIAFKRHVSDALPHARHVELDCGHVPQIERPRQTNAELAAFFSEAVEGERG